MKRTLECTLLVSESRRYPYLKARIGPQRSMKQDEVAVPLSVTLDTAWFRKTTERQRVELPDPPTPTAEVRT